MGDCPERRAHARQRVSFRLVYAHRNGDSVPMTGEGFVLNIGRAGALVRINRHFPPGRELAVEISCPNRLIKAACEVVHARRIGPDLHELGLWFQKVESIRSAPEQEAVEVAYEPLEPDEPSFPELIE